MKAKSRSAKYYNSHPEAKAKKKRYDTKLNKRKEQVKKRVEANRANRKAGTYGNGDGKDYDHAVGKMVDASVNRGRKGEGGRKTKTNNMNTKKKTYNVGGKLAKAAKKAKEKAKTKKAFKSGGKVKYSYGGKKKAK